MKRVGHVYNEKENRTKNCLDIHRLNGDFHHGAVDYRRRLHVKNKS
jgi:hypothetical protein